MQNRTELVVDTGEASISRLAELYRLHADDVFAVALRITGSRADAEDVLQDVFVGLPRALRGYREQGRFDAWLRRVTVRTALMRMRSMRRRREDALDPSTDELPGRELSVIDRIALERALAALPDPLRVVLVLREIEGYTHDQIASLLGISAGASATRLSRAWVSLRKELRP